MQALRAIAVSMWIPVALISIWQVWSTLENSLFFPAPGVIALELAALLEPSAIGTYLLPTLLVLLAGYFSGAVAGVLMGVLVGASKYWFKVLTPVAVFARGVPIAALLPVIIGIFGLGPSALLAAVVFSVLMNVYVATAVGVARVPNTLIEQAQLLGLSFWESALRIRFFAASGDILVGLQTALQSSLVTVVVGEILVSPHGLGSLLRESQELFSISKMWSGIVLLGIVGVVANWLFLRAEAPVYAWYFSTRENRN